MSKTTRVIERMFSCFTRTSSSTEGSPSRALGGLNPAIPNEAHDSAARAARPAVGVQMSDPAPDFRTIFRFERYIERHVLENLCGN